MPSNPTGTHTLRKIVGIAANHASADTHLDITVEGALLAKKLDAGAVLQASAIPTEESARRLLATRQYYALITKNPCLVDADPDERAAQAYKKFKEMMKRNARTNKRLKHFANRPLRWAAKMPDVSAVFSSARLELFRLLGPCPGSSDWDNFSSAKVFSKGTIQGIGRLRQYIDVDAYQKLSSDQVLTGSSECFETFGHLLIDGCYSSLLHEYLQKGCLKVSESNVSKAECVNKDALVDRFIAIEALLNSMAQQGIRSMLDPYLKRWGVNLTDQGVNRVLARIASKRGFSPSGFSTVDLSSASDTVTIELVRYLLPKGWFDLLYSARSTHIQKDNDVFLSPCFSTMGNAFTFPLQCLVFMSLVRAAMQHCHIDDARCCVYGDDIIIPSGATALLVECLRFGGFIPNVQKSFITGFFRESCGGDYLDGHDVRPVYLKDDIGATDVKHQFFNALQSKIPGHPVLPYLYSTVKRPLIGPAIGPSGGETSHFVSPLWLLRKRRMVSYHTDSQSYIYRYPAYVSTSRKRLRRNELVRYLAALTGNYGRCHDIRGSQRFSIEVRMTTTPWVQAAFAPFWYEYQR